MSAKQKTDSSKSTESTAEEGAEWTYRGWYGKNKEALSQRRKKRYHGDKQYRKKVLAQNKNYRAKKATERPASSKVRVRAANHRKPVVMRIDLGGVDQDVTMVHIGAFARAISRSIPTIHQWERLGLLPKTPFLLCGKSKQERLYTPDMIAVVRTALKTRKKSVSATDANFNKEILEGWISLGIHMEKSS